MSDADDSNAGERETGTTDMRDDDFEWGRRNGPRGASSGRRGRSRDTFIVIGVALVLLIVVAGIVIAGKKNKDDGTASGRTTTTSASGTTSSGGAGRKAGCPSWPALYRVQPSALTKDGAAPGVYVWNDPFTGWHVRVVGGEGMQLLNGTMVSSGKRVDAKANPDGAAKLTPKGNTLSFEVGPASKPVGFDAVVGCQADQISFTFNNNGTALPANMVFVGDGNSAVSNPLVVQRASS